MIMYPLLTEAEELKSLRAEFIYINNLLKDASLLAQPEIKELEALKAYITVRLTNLRNQLKD